MSANILLEPEVREEVNPSLVCIPGHESFWSFEYSLHESNHLLYLAVNDFICSKKSFSIVLLLRSIIGITSFSSFSRKLMGLTP